MTATLNSQGNKIEGKTKKKKKEKRNDVPISKKSEIRIEKRNYKILLR